MVEPGQRTNAKEEVDMSAETGMRSLMSSLLLIVISICTCMRLAVADPETSTVWSVCGNSGKNEYRNGSAFQHNLNKVLESLCRGDLDSSDCKQCVSTAKANLVAGCQNTSGFIQLDGCFLRYDSHRFYSDIESRKSLPVSVLCNTGNSNRPQQFTNAVQGLLSNITVKAAESPKLFAADTVAEPSSLTKKIYSLAQCWRDLSHTSCGSCLTYAFEKVLSCQIGAFGAQFESQNCYLRYEVYEFFNSSVLSPQPEESPPESSEGKKGRVSAITLGLVAGGMLGLIVTTSLFLAQHLFNKYMRPPSSKASYSILDTNDI